MNLSVERNSGAIVSLPSREFGQNSTPVVVVGSVAVVIAVIAVVV